MWNVYRFPRWLVALRIHAMSTAHQLGPKPRDAGNPWAYMEMVNIYPQNGDLEMVYDDMLPLVLPLVLPHTVLFIIKSCSCWLSGRFEIRRDPKRTVFVQGCSVVFQGRLGQVLAKYEGLGKYEVFQNMTPETKTHKTTEWTHLAAAWRSGTAMVSIRPPWMEDRVLDTQGFIPFYTS